MPYYHKNFATCKNGSNFASLFLVFSNTEAKIMSINYKNVKDMDLDMKLVALGDSIIKGVLFSEEENGHGHYSLSDLNIVDHLANRLHCETINLGKMGSTIESGERILDRYADRIEGANYVLICYGGNDSDYDWNAIANYPGGEHHPKTSLSAFEKTYSRIIHKLRSAGFTPTHNFFCASVFMNAHSYFNHFTRRFDSQQKKNVLKWLKGSVDTIWAGHELYNDAIKRVAQTTNTRLIDVTSVLLRHNDYLCADGIHPNNRGYQLIAKSVLSAI